MAYPPLAHPRPDIAGQFRRSILDAGGMVVGPNGETLRPGDELRRPEVGGVVMHPPEPPRTPHPEGTRHPPLPSVIEFEEEGQEHTVVVKRRSGELVTLHGALRYGAMRDFDDLQREVVRLQEATKEATDRQTRKRLAAEQLAVEEDLLRLLFDDLPDGLIGSLDPRTVRKLTETFGRMLQEAIGGGYPLGDDSPNGSAGR